MARSTKRAGKSRVDARLPSNGNLSVKLGRMEPSDPAPAKDFARQSREFPDSPRLSAWLAVSTTPLDLLALCTIWLTIVPIANLDNLSGKPEYWWTGRVALSFVYFLDMAVRVRLSGQGIRYALRHPIGVLAVIVPAVRILFSLRLLGAMFRKGNLTHFLLVAGILLLNISVIVYAFETRATDANITSIGISLWWACVTVATVGYGDYFPVTLGGRISAVTLMVIGLTTIGVVTAQIASSFMDQAAARRTALADSDSDSESETESETESESDSDKLSATVQSTTPVSLTEPGSVEARLARIEQLLLDQNAKAPGDKR
jgi:voltage-gated potassium channel